MQSDLFDPVFDLLKGLTIVNSVCHDDSHCTSVIGLRDGFEAFLSGSIPDLEADFLAVEVNGFDFEVDSWVSYWLPIVVR